MERCLFNVGEAMERNFKGKETKNIPKLWTTTKYCNTQGKTTGTIKKSYPIGRQCIVDKNLKNFGMLTVLKIDEVIQQQSANYSDKD